MIDYFSFELSDASNIISIWKTDFFNFLRKNSGKFEGDYSIEVLEIYRHDLIEHVENFLVLVHRLGEIDGQISFCNDICEIAGGMIASDIKDIYPSQKERNTLTVSYSSMNELAGKEYSKEQVKRILN